MCNARHKTTAGAEAIHRYSKILDFDEPSPIDDALLVNDTDRICYVIAESAVRNLGPFQTLTYRPNHHYYACFFLTVGIELDRLRVRPDLI